MKKLLGLMVGMLVVASCTTQNPLATKTSLQDKWELISLDGEPVFSNKPIYIEFDKNNQISGTSGCNTMTGTYSVTNESQVKFDKLASTRMMCEPNQMKLEKEVLDMLKTTNNFTIIGDVLSMNIGKRAPIAVFHRMSKEKIVNKYWKLIELDGKPVVMDKNQEREAFFMLRSDNSMTGFAGCNTFNGKVELQPGKRLKFYDQMPMTMKACPDMKINESGMMEVFRLADNYTIDNDVLSLNVGRRMPLAKFQAVYF